MGQRLVKFNTETFRGDFNVLPNAKEEDGSFAIVTDRNNDIYVASNGEWKSTVFNSDRTAILDPDGNSLNLNAPSSKLLACIPARDATTRFSDITDKANHLAVEAGNTDAFDNDGYFTTTASTTGGLNIPQADVAWNPAIESIICSFVMKRAAPGGNENVLSLGSTAAGYQGFYLSHRATSGIIKLVPILNSGSLGSNVDSSLTFSDGTPKDRVCTVAFDAPTGSWYMWRDGIPVIASVGLSTGANAYTNVVSSADLRIGALDEVSTNACVVVVGRGLQFAKYEGSLPTNIGLIAARLAETPSLPITAMEW